MDLNKKIAAAKRYLKNAQAVTQGKLGYIYSDFKINHLSIELKQLINSKTPNQIPLIAEILVKAGYGISHSYKYQRRRTRTALNKYYLTPQEFLKVCKKYGLPINPTILQQLIKNRLLFVRARGIHVYSIVLIADYYNFFQDKAIEYLLTGKSLKVRAVVSGLTRIHNTWVKYLPLLDEIEYQHFQASQFGVHGIIHKFPDKYKIIYFAALKNILRTNQALLNSLTPDILQKDLLELRDRFALLAINNNALANQLLQYPFAVEDAFDKAKSRLSGKSLYSVFARDKYELLNLVVEILFNEVNEISSYLPGYKGTTTPCLICKKPILQSSTGRKRIYCSAKCRSKALRRSKSQ